MPEATHKMTFRARGCTAVVQLHEYDARGKNGGGANVGGAQHSTPRMWCRRYMLVLPRYSYCIYLCTAGHVDQVVAFVVAQNWINCCRRTA